MAIVFPIIEDKDALIQFATSRLGCSSEDLELLTNTCTTLIEDAKIINSFIFGPSLLSTNESMRQEIRVDSASLPINYYRGGMPLVPVSFPNAYLGGSEPIENLQSLFRPHESLLRSVRTRLKKGKTTLIGLNEKYDYGFTVVTFGKGPVQGSLKGETVTVETNERDQSMKEDSTTMRQIQETVVSIHNNNKNKNSESLRVRMVYMKFIQTFDFLIPWVSNILGVLDGEGAVPSSGKYVLPERSENEVEGQTNIARDTKTSHEDNVNSLTQFHSPIPTQQLPQQGIVNTSSEESSSLVSNVTSANTRRFRTVRVTKYELHDVSSVFRSFQNQVRLFYLPEYTFYDPRVQKRLLLPAYYQALRETIYEINSEIDRLEQLAASLTREKPNGSTIVFKPTICEFRYLRDSLRLYWSSCVTEDDITSFKYYHMQYSKYLLEAGEVMDMLKQLRRPPALDDSTIRRWILTPEERGALETGFESFWRIRDHVLELRDSLTKDIEQKNRTHRYRISVPPPSLKSKSGNENDSGVTQWMFSAIRSWAQIVTCNAEISDKSLSLGRDDEGFLLSSNSPMYESKVELLHLVYRMVNVVELQAKTLERDYPGIFFRDTKSMWAHRANGVIRHIESMSVVFSPPK